MSILIDLTEQNIHENARKRTSAERAGFIDLTSSVSFSPPKDTERDVVILDAQAEQVSAPAITDEQPRAASRTAHKRCRDPPELSIVEPASGRCDICIDDIALPFMHTFGSCGHAFCLQCLREYVSGKVEGREFPVPCPLPSCKTAIPTLECCLVLTPAEQEIIGKLEAEAAIDCTTKLYCPNASCSMLLIAEEKQQDAPMDCPHCAKPICTSCGVLWHAGLTCQQFQALPPHAREGADVGLLELADKEKWRRCPKCGTMVERIEGCSFIRCKCRHCFCYSCGNTLSPHNHYCSCKSHREQWAPPRPDHPRLPAPVPHGMPGAAAAGGPFGVLPPPFGMGMDLGEMHAQMVGLGRRLRGFWGVPPGQQAPAPAIQPQPQRRPPGNAPLQKGPPPHAPQWGLLQEPPPPPGDMLDHFRKARRRRREAALAAGVSAIWAGAAGAQRPVLAGAGLAEVGPQHRHGAFLAVEEVAGAGAAAADAGLVGRVHGSAADQEVHPPSPRAERGRGLQGAAGPGMGRVAEAHGLQPGAAEYGRGEPGWWQEGGLPGASAVADPSSAPNAQPHALGRKRRRRR